MVSIGIITQQIAQQFEWATPPKTNNQLSITNNYYIQHKKLKQVMSCR